MSTTADKLLYLQGTKSAIKDAIVAKGVSVPTGTPFREYADKIGDITTGSSDWVRPSEWLALPDNVDGVQKVSILNAVFDTDSEFVALLCRGAYTVDWGDGVVEDFADNVKAEHKYTYSDTDLNSDTLATFGYKQCIITITPQAGNNLTYISLRQIHSTLGANYSVRTGFLDIRINSIYLTTIFISNNSTTTNDGNTAFQHSMLEQVVIDEHSCTSFGYLLTTCQSLQSSLINTTGITSMLQMHTQNIALKYVPNYDFSSCTTLNSCFFSCYSLVGAKYTLNTTSSLIDISSMFSNCQSLINQVNFSNTTNVIAIASLYSSCASLKKVENYSFPSATGSSNMFNSGTYSLKEINNLTIGSGATSLFTSSLNSPRGLKKVIMSVSVSFYVANQCLSATALNEMYTALPTVTGQTVTVTGNYGVSGDDPTIATSKGWTVVG